MAVITISPGTSIQTTINSATAGDTIALNSGTYQSDNSLTFSKSITYSPWYLVVIQI